MTELIATVSKDNWPHVQRLIKDGDWEKIILITDSAGKSAFKSDKSADYLVVDFQKPVSDLIGDIQKGLKEKISGFEVAINLVSGTGKEHMAIISALCKIGIGLRFVAVTKEGIKEL